MNFENMGDGNNIEQPEENKEEAEKQLIAEIMANLELGSLRYRAGMDIIGGKRIRVELLEGQVAGHKVQLFYSDKLRIDGKEIDAPELKQKITDLNQEQYFNEQIEIVALKNEISQALSSQSLRHRKAMELAGKRWKKLNIYEGEIAGHKIRLLMPFNELSIDGQAKKGGDWQDLIDKIIEITPQEE